MGMSVDETNWTVAVGMGCQPLIPKSVRRQQPE